MKTIRVYYVKPADYQAMHDFFTSKRTYEFATEWVKSKQLFKFTVHTDENYYTAVMQDLCDLSNTIDGYEYKDSLNVAIASIKTLLDMGVLK